MPFSAYKFSVPQNEANTLFYNAFPSLLSWMHWAIPDTTDGSCNDILADVLQNIHRASQSSAAISEQAKLDKLSGETASITGDHDSAAYIFRRRPLSVSLSAPGAV